MRSSARPLQLLAIESAQDFESVGVQLLRALRGLFRFGIHSEPSVRIREVDIDPWVVRIGLCGDQELLKRLLEVLLTMKLHAAPKAGNRFDGFARRACCCGRGRGTGRW